MKDYINFTVEPSSDIEYWSIPLNFVCNDLKEWDSLTEEKQKFIIQEYINNCNEELKFKLKKLDGHVKK